MKPTKADDAKKKEECFDDETKMAAGKAEDVADDNGGGSTTPKAPIGSASPEGAVVAGETVRLISSEGTHLDVPLNIVKECEVLERMLSSSFMESKTRELSLPNIRYRILCKAVDYLKRRRQWREGGGAPLEFEIDDDIAVELLIAADFLGMK